MKIRVPLRDGGTTVIRGGHQASFFHGIVGRDKARLLGTASRESLLKRGTRTTRSSVSTTARWTTAPRRPLVPRALGRGRRSATTARAGGDAEPSILPRIDLQPERTDGEATEGGGVSDGPKRRVFPGWQFKPPNRGSRWTTAPRRPLVPRALGRGWRSATTASRQRRRRALDLFRG